MLYVKPNITVVIRQLKFVQCLKTKSMSTIGLVKRTYLNEVTKSQTINFVSKWTGQRYMSRKAEELTKKLDSDCVKPGDVDETKLDDVDLDYLEEIDGEKRDLLDNKFKESNVELFKEIANGDEEKLQLLKCLETKFSIACAEINVVPNLTKADWIHLLEIGVPARAKYLTYLLKVAHCRKLKEHERKVRKSLYLDGGDICLKSDFTDPNCYHLFHNAMFIKYHSKSLKIMSFAKVMKTLLYGPELLIDCSYDEYMTDVEKKYCAKQIISGLILNLQSELPYHIVLCNFHRNGGVGRYLPRFSGLCYDPGYPLTMTNKSYLDLYPKDSLVYLTPHSKKDLTNFDPTKRYIIGGFVDKSVRHPISVVKAKKESIAMARFPLDLYLKWTSGSKSLTINHCISIMLTMMQHNDWKEAFKIIPQRHLTVRTTAKKRNGLYSLVRSVF